LMAQAGSPANPLKKNLVSRSVNPVDPKGWGRAGVGALATASRPRNLNKTSIKPAVYGERFVKRRGLFCLAVAPPHGVVQVA
jgi:hypothetical protein